ncbi:Nucleoside-diphosphate-sugar epimerase [Desulfuromusa kysingii]|uniref:Nucleoside-diphosphate-sugar epimerase n=1 Tax=Desulfuromusa kysingii TaxID=37625 RepID=A0A1H4DNZ1_9BACT|nr:NAD-dependent epimerase/dehydratase family protein [Desulfuromusa kysingii]SEA74503.1 Nucleoside-diphosphate-sugar epimerase [Desulfuromusa kysingii]
MKVLVTGGGGFLGKAIVMQLLQQGDEVCSFSRNIYPQLTRLGVEQFVGDLADQSAVVHAADGCDLVFHVAAKAGVWGRYEQFYQPNVVGTRNVIQACRKCAITRLVYTSSPSVVFDGSDMENIDESAPYPDHFLSAYPQTKAEAEQLVLAANDTSLATVALRPHLIWGPDDNHLVPRILERGRAGSLRRIGDRPCLVDTVYIDNAAKAHLLAAKHLVADSSCAGKAYFIANDEPLPLWDMINKILAVGGVEPINKTVSPSIAYAAGWFLERCYQGLRISTEPRLTRFVAKELSTSHWFNLTAAKNDLGYRPDVSIAEGLGHLQEWLQGKH